MPILKSVIAESVFRYSVNGVSTQNRALNVIHWRADIYVGDENSNAQAVADVLSERWSAGVRPLMSSDYAYLGCLVQFLVGTLRTAGAESIVGQGPGTVADVPLPNQNSVNLKKLTAYAGREYRGRIYIPGVTVSSQDNGQTTAAYRLLLEASSLKAMCTNPVNVPLVDPNVILKMVVSRKPWVVGDYSSPPVTRCAWDPVIRAQRRRQPGRGY